MSEEKRTLNDFSDGGEYPVDTSVYVDGKKLESNVLNPFGRINRPMGTFEIKNKPSYIQPSNIKEILNRKQTSNTRNPGSEISKSPQEREKEANLKEARFMAEWIQSIGGKIVGTPENPKLFLPPEFIEGEETAWLRGENASLIKKLNELSTKYDKLVAQYNTDIHRHNEDVGRLTQSLTELTATIGDLQKKVNYATVLQTEESSVLKSSIVENNITDTEKKTPLDTPDTGKNPATKPTSFGGVLRSFRPLKSSLPVHKGEEMPATIQQQSIKTVDDVNRLREGEEFFERYVDEFKKDRNQFLENYRSKKWSSENEKRSMERVMRGALVETSTMLTQKRYEIDNKTKLGSEELAKKNEGERESYKKILDITVGGLEQEVLDLEEKRKEIEQHLEGIVTNTPSSLRDDLFSHKESPLEESATPIVPDTIHATKSQQEVREHGITLQEEINESIPTQEKEIPAQLPPSLYSNQEEPSAPEGVKAVTENTPFTKGKNDQPHILTPEETERRTANVAKLLNTLTPLLVSKYGRTWRAFIAALVIGTGSSTVEATQQAPKTPQTLQTLTSWTDFLAPAQRHFLNDIIGDTQLSFADLVKKYSPLVVDPHGNNPSRLHDISSMKCVDLLSSPLPVYGLTNDQRKELCSVVLNLETIVQAAEAGEAMVTTFTKTPYNYKNQAITLEEFFTDAKKIALQTTLQGTSKNKKRI